MTLKLNFYCFKSEQQNAPLEAGLGSPQGEMQQALRAAGLNKHCFSSVLWDLYLEGSDTCWNAKCPWI